MLDLWNQTREKGICVNCAVGYFFESAWTFREGVLKIKLKSEKVMFGLFGYVQAPHHEPAN